MKIKLCEFEKWFNRYCKTKNPLMSGHWWAKLGWDAAMKSKSKKSRKSKAKLSPPSKENQKAINMLSMLRNN